MPDIQSVIMKYRFGNQFRILLLIIASALILFHMFVLLLPFIVSVNQDHINNIRYISDTISGITIAVILMILIVEGQRSVRSAIRLQRSNDYRNIGDQITRWLQKSGSKAFDPNVVDSKTTEEHEIYRNFKVTGSASRIAERDHLSMQQVNAINHYCEKVHFELTSYPSEIIYGLHFELDDFETNRVLCERLKDELALTRQTCEICEDNTIPKKPNWFFVTRTVELEGDIDNDFPKVLTHGRHFVEFVCHSYDIVYGKTMVKFFLDQIEQKGKFDLIRSNETST